MTTEERIAHLEAKIDRLQEANDLVSQELAQARVDQWQGRIDDLELQVHLGVTEATDRLSDVTSELTTRWSKARQQLINASETTAEVTDTIRSGLESAYQDVRTALIESRKQLS